MQENRSLGFPARSDINQYAQLLNMARDLKLRIVLSVKLKTKALISTTITGQLICAFFFAYAKIWFSHDTAQIMSASI